MPHQKYIRGDFMAIPEYIRKVPRPVNTVVVDNGKDGPNRYAVRERAGTQCCPRVVLADKCASIVRSYTVSRDGWAYDPERGNCHYSACVLCGIDIQKVSQDIGRNGFRKCGCPIR